MSVLIRTDREDGICTSLDTIRAKLCDSITEGNRNRGRAFKHFVPTEEEEETTEEWGHSWR